MMTGELGNEVLLFNGSSLAGWHAVPRVPVPQSPLAPPIDMHSDEYIAAAANAGRWVVEDGQIVGGQEPPGSGFGGYLITDDVFGDFELSFDVKPDWPADTGIVLRGTELGAQGFQVLIDHRKSGAIGGFYGNGIGGFHALTHAVDVVRDESGNPCGLTEEDPATTLEQITDAKRAILRYAASPDAFHSAWKWGEFNNIRVRCEGEFPVLTTWINDVKIYEIDTGTVDYPGYDRAAAARLLGRRGHISLEVHDNDPAMGAARWGVGCVVRWRNISLREILPRAIN